MTKKPSPRKSAPKATGERIVEGLAAAPGIAIGPAAPRGSDTLEVGTYTVPKSKLKAEVARLDNAVKVARRQISLLRERAARLHGSAGEELVYLFDAYLAMLDDSRLVRGARAAITDKRINAEAAVLSQYSALAEQFKAMQDAYIAARLDDIREVAMRLIGVLSRVPDRPAAPLPKGAVVLASELSPADMAQIDPDQVVAVAAAFGGVEGHTAIMARALGLPAVLGAQGLTDGVEPGTTVIVDGNTGRIVISPSAATVRTYEKQRAKSLRGVRALDRLRDEPAITRDDVAINLHANVELPVEMDMVLQSGARGIGLLRSEFMFMNRDDIPGEDEQTAILQTIAGRMGDLPVTIRTLDIGGEKAAPALLDGLDEAAASALGLRGIRLSLAHPDLLRVQFRAILRVAAKHQVRILLPMVTTVSEMRRARKLLDETAKKMRRAGIAVPATLPPLGAMIEVPGAALAADALAQVSDFFAIGSNDLTMYTLAVDRTNEHVAPLYNGLHPAVLRLIQFSTEAALRARIPVSICGEMAGDPRLAPILIGLGLRDLSMSAANVPQVKQRILRLDALAARQRAMQIMEQTDSGRIAMLIEDFNALA